jgi:hypothetical protein
MEVNLEELDQIIDRSTQTPLSKSEGQKLKTAIHAMAERVPPRKSVRPERAGNAGEIRGARTVGSDRIPDGATALQCLRADL